MAGVVPPPVRAAMLAAAVRSRWPVNWQAGQARTRPGGLGTRDRQAGQVEEVPRSSTSCRLNPGGLSLVGQRGDQVADPPVPGALVMPPPGFEPEDTAGVAHC
jgi:hypothetical protein